MKEKISISYDVSLKAITVMIGKHKFMVSMKLLECLAKEGKAMVSYDGIVWDIEQVIK